MTITCKITKAPERERFTIKTLKRGDIFKYSGNKGKDWMDKVYICTGRMNNIPQCLDLSLNISAEFVDPESVFMVFNKMQLSESNEFVS